MKRLIPCLLLLCLVAGGCRLVQQQIEGRISVAGNEPFSYVRLVDPEQHEYRLVGPEAARIRRTLQGRDVILKGKIVRDAVGPGMPAEFEVREVVPR